MENYSESAITPQEENMLSDELLQMQQHADASAGQRFVNFLVDNLLMQYGLSYVTGTFVGFLLGSLFPEFTRRLIESGEQGDLLILAYIVAIFNYLFYYTICEKAFKGYTLGKLISGTRAIRTDGQELTLKDALLRTVSRLVPFEAFSAFGGHPWHDTWTKTKVIKSR
jgi:uncharacterized RDD family membrane protein YckC